MFVRFSGVRGEIASVRTELKGEIDSVRGELAAFGEESSRKHGEIVGQMIHIQNSLSVQIQETKDALGSPRQEFAGTRGEIMAEAREVARETARGEGMARRQRVEAELAAGPEGIREGAGERAGEAGLG